MQEKGYNQQTNAITFDSVSGLNIFFFFWSNREMIRLYKNALAMPQKLMFIKLKMADGSST